MKRTLYLMLVAVTIITACQSKTKTASNDAAAIRNIEDQWVAANKVKDINKAVSYFASDAVVMEPNKPITVGIEAIKKSWEEWFSDTTYLHNETTSKIDTIVVSTSGNLAYVRETNHYKVKTPNGIVEFDDKCIYIYNKSKDGWKCTVDIWNYDKPQ